MPTPEAEAADVAAAEDVADGVSADRLRSPEAVVDVDVPVFPERFRSAVAVPSPIRLADTVAVSIGAAPVVPCADAEPAPEVEPVVAWRASTEAPAPLPVVALWVVTEDCEPLVCPVAGLATAAPVVPCADAELAPDVAPVPPAAPPCAPEALSVRGREAS